jgi:hypothetical protein
MRNSSSGSTRSRSWSTRSIPLSFADGLYGLRSHIQFVRKRIQFLMGEAATEAAPV